MIDEDDLRDCFAMFAMLGFISRGTDSAWEPKEAYEIADEMIEARKVKDEAGIAGIGKRKYVRKNYD